MNPSDEMNKLESTMKAYGLTDTSIPLIELSRNQGPDFLGKPLNNLSDRQLADAIRMVLCSDIMLQIRRHERAITDAVFWRDRQNRSACGCLTHPRQATVSLSA